MIACLVTPIVMLLCIKTSNVACYSGYFFNLEQNHSSEPLKCIVGHPCKCNSSGSFEMGSTNGVHCEGQGLYTRQFVSILTLNASTHTYSSYTLLNISHNNLNNNPPLYHTVDPFFRQLDQLETLDLSYNSFMVMPVFVKRLEGLTVLLCSNNLIGRTVSEGGTASVSSLSIYLHPNQHLRVIDLSNNYIHNLPRSLFADLYSLNELLLSGNEIEEWPRGIFSGCPYVETLDLQSNSISRIHHGSFSHLINLHVLNLNRNALMELDPTIFKHLGELHVLYCRGNNINEIENGTFLNTPELTELDLSQNSLRGLKEGVFSSLRHFHYLDLSSNNIMGLQEHSFGNSSASLQYLDLSQNHMTFLPTSFFTNFISLQYLNLSCQPLMILPDLSSLTHLLTLSISSTRSATLLPCQLPHLSTANLQILEWSRTPLVCDCNMKWLKEWSLTLDAMSKNETQSWVCEYPSKLHHLSVYDLQPNAFVCDSYKSPSYCTHFVTYQVNLSVSIVHERSDSVSIHWRLDSNPKLTVQQTHVWYTEVFAEQDEYILNYMIGFFSFHHLLHYLHIPSISLKHVSFEKSKSDFTVTGLKHNSTYMVCVEVRNSQNHTIAYNCARATTLSNPQEQSEELHSSLRLGLPIALGTLLAIIVLVIICTMAKLRQWRLCKKYSETLAAGVENLGYNIELNNSQDIVI